MDKEQVLETDVFDLLDKIPYIPSREELDVEQCILDYMASNVKVDEYSDEALSVILQDLYMGDVAEKIRGAAAGARIKFKNYARSLGTFVRFLQRLTINSIVGEKFIRKRFDGLKTKYVNFFYVELADKHAYVMAPSYETISRRLIGLNKCVMYLKSAAESPNPSNSITMDTYAKLVEMSAGVFSLRSSASGLVNHLVWSPPTIEQIYLANSPWSKVENINNLCNSVLFVKYKTMEGVNDIVKACLKRTKELSDKAEDYASYDVEEDTAEQYMHDYGSAYMISKMVKDIVKQGIQREINTLTINYIHKLKSIKTSD